MSAIAKRFPEMPGVLYAFAFPRWKWPVVRQCFEGKKIVFVSSAESVPETAWVLIWGRSALPEGLTAVSRVLRLEDGFLRSVGLGAELTKPLSWVVDTRGIYYDATCPSDLEVILATHSFDAGQCNRAASLRLSVVDSRLTKYNVGAQSWRRPDNELRVVLVPGQVESDASLAYGAPEVRGNMELLALVRAARPDAYLIYKPHPDVLAGLRKEGANERDAKNWCDEVVGDVSIGTLLPLVDEVHVLTSLCGFEALLHRKEVWCYGQPFYSGWGLTHDRLPQSRRQRRLTLDELVAGVLVEYPMYMSRTGKGLTSPEDAIKSLLQWRKIRGTRLKFWQPITRIFLRLFIGVR